MGEGGIGLGVRVRVRVRVRVCYRDNSSLGGIQAKLNASMYLKPYSLGFLFARILR